MKQGTSLNIVIKTNGIPNGFPSKAKVLTVQAEEDAIVLPSARDLLVKDLTNHLEITPTVWKIKGAGHSLLFPELVERIQVWLDSKQ